MKYSQVLIMYMYVYDCLVNVYGYCMVYIVGLAWFWGIIVFIITTTLLIIIVTIIMAVMIIIVDIPILVLISIFICVSLHY